MPDQYGVIEAVNVQYIGPFDFEELYRHLYEWLEWRGYDVREKKYKDKVKPKRPIQRELEIDWFASREVDEYTRFQYKISFRIINLKEIEAKRDGETRKIWQADIDILIWAYMLLDKDDKWEESTILHFFKKFFETYVYKGQVDKWEEVLYWEALAFKDEAKALLNLYKT